MRTFCLNLIALIKGEIGSEEFVVVFVGHEWGDSELREEAFLVPFC